MSKITKKIEPAPLVIVARAAAEIMTWMFIILNLILYYFYSDERAASLVCSLFLVAFQFPRLVYWIECSRLNKLTN